MDGIPTDVAVIGAGPAGLTAAIALASSGASVALVGSPASDTRTTALLASSVTALETLGVWRECAAHAAPLEVMRLVDDTGRLWRAPETSFSASEIGLAAFGWNIENRHLVAALSAAVATTPTIRSFAQPARALQFTPDAAMISLDGGAELRAHLVVAADGRNSMCREAAGITTVGWSYPQTAITVNLVHARSHQNTSTEFHTVQGPFTLVPLPGARSSLVCVVRPDDAEALMALDDVALSAEIERRAHSMLGKVAVESARGKFPLRVDSAASVAACRLVLIGEAAHTLPPIGAQGFNLGLRDVATIAELVAEARGNGRDIGGTPVTENYNRSRRADTKSRTLAADLLNRSLLSDFFPAQGLRGLGLYLVGRIGPLRRAAMREGVAPAAAMPKLMRGEAI